MQQLDLFSSLSAPAPVNDIFLAILPDLETTQSLAALTTRLQNQYGLRGKPRPMDHLHITLHDVGRFREVPDVLIQSISRACDAIARKTMAFEITLNQALSFRRNSAPYPLVLEGDSTANAALFTLHEHLLSVLKSPTGQDSKSTSFRPHLTLSYADAMPNAVSIEPIRWTACEMVLINSVQGRTQHQHLAKWSFGA
jgi:2'-5' RNA ligase